MVAGQPVSATIPDPGDKVGCDFVTGGGWILGSGSATSSLAAGAKANFAVGGGVKNGAFWGHLEYTDHSTSPPMKVHGTGVTDYAPGTNPNERIIMGTARINGVDGFTYTVEVTDYLEPGRGIDEFSISLSNGYVAGTDDGDGPIAGGNIQLHRRNPSNTPPPGFSCA
ncbi:MAG: post-COAP-1 domain-containing protein [Gaiellales bacterium]